jgi:hypothetical protein
VIAGARTPEELETLLEDAFVMHDRMEFGALYDEGAVLVAGAAGPEARGGEAIGRAVSALWAADCTYVGETRRVLQARDLALVVGNDGVHVLRRATGGGWRVAISLLDVDGSTEQEDR